MKKFNKKIQSSFIAFTLVLFAGGCSNSAFEHFDKDPEFIKNTKTTKVIKIVDDEIVKAMTNITSLNQANPTKWDNGKQNFIIGTYTIDENKECCSLELHVFHKKKIQLDEKNIEYEKKILIPFEEKIILKDDPLYNSIPLRNNWATYKLVSYEDSEEIQDFHFTFKDKVNNSVKITFSKD